MGCADPPSKGAGAPHQCSRVNEQRSGGGLGGGSSLALQEPEAVIKAPANRRVFRGIEP